MRDNAKAVVREVFKQPIYSLIRREIEEEILPFCQREGIGVIVYSPMASGLLTHGRLMVLASIRIFMASKTLQ